MRNTLSAFFTACLLSGCATTSATFYRAPNRTDLTAICRAYFKEESSDTYRADLFAEITRRGYTVDQCRWRVDEQNKAIAVGVVVAGVAALAIAACANGACPRGGSATPVDYDCAGGPGDGPLYQPGPISVRDGDPYRLDADGDGIGCEPYDDYGQ